MKRHIKGEISGTGRFTNLSVQNLDVVNISGVLQQRLEKLEKENVELHNKLEEINMFLQNLTLKNLKDVTINEDLHDGDTIGWDSNDKGWVIFSESG